MDSIVGYEVERYMDREQRRGSQGRRWSTRRNVYVCSGYFSNSSNLSGYFSNYEIVTGYFGNFPNL